MSVTFTITEEARDIALKYGKNVSQGIIGMQDEIDHKNVVPIQSDITEEIVRKVVKEVVSKEMIQLREGIKGSLKNLGDMIISGQGILNRDDHMVKGPMGPSVGNEKYGPARSTPEKSLDVESTSSFVRASELKKEGV